MKFLTIPRLGMVDRLKESIPIILDEKTGIIRLLEGAVTLAPDVEYPHSVKMAAALASK